MKYFTIIVYLLSHSFVYSQNLVKSDSFEVVQAIHAFNTKFNKNIKTENLIVIKKSLFVNTSPLLHYEEFAYDSLGQIIATIYDSKQEFYEFDEHGRLRIATTLQSGLITNTAKIDYKKEGDTTLITVTDNERLIISEKIYTPIWTRISIKTNYTSNSNIAPLLFSTEISHFDKNNRFFSIQTKTRRGKTREKYYRLTRECHNVSTKEKYYYKKGDLHKVKVRVNAKRKLLYFFSYNSEKHLISVKQIDKKSKIDSTVWHFKYNSNNCYTTIVASEFKKGVENIKTSYEVICSSKFYCEYYSKELINNSTVLWLLIPDTLISDVFK